MMAALTRKGPLAIPVGRAVDILDVVQSMGTCSAFTVGCGWKAEEYRAWRYRTVTQLLPELLQGHAAQADPAATWGMSFYRLIAGDAEIAGDGVRAARNGGRPWHLSAARP